MENQLLRHIPTGILYVWQPAFAQRDDFEDVEDANADIVTPKHPKKRAKPIPVVNAVDNDALSADASRNLPSIVTGFGTL